MESIKTATRIHPLMAAAAVSVVIVSLAGTAAITGLLPSSHSAPATVPSELVAAPVPMALAAAPMQDSVEEAPVAAVKKAAVIKHAAPRPRVVHHYHEVARNDSQQSYRAAAVPAPVPAQPNYVGIGMGAVVGGLLGNQVGSGNGRKAATVAGLLGGAYVGNEIANRNK